MTLKTENRVLIITSQRSWSTYVMHLWPNHYVKWSEPWDPTSEAWGQDLIGPTHSVTKTHARDIMNQPSIDLTQWDDVRVLRRRDVRSQILSLARARQSQQWACHSDQELAEVKPCRVTWSKLSSAYRAIINQVGYLSQLPYPVTWCEDLTGVADQDRRLMGIEPSPHQPPTVRMPDLVDSIANHQECVAWLDDLWLKDARTAYIPHHGRL